MRNILLCTAALCALPLVACSETPEPEMAPQNAYAQPTPTTTVPAGQGAAAPIPSGQGAGPAAPSGAGGGAPNAAGTASPLPAGMVVGLQPILKTMVSRDIRGMREDGSPAAAQFTEGQIFEIPITLQPGRCYTAVAVGVGITELDLEIVIHQAPAPEFVAATDQDTGYKAVVAEAPNCFRNPLPFSAPAKLRARAVTGAGPAIVQLYSR